MFQGLCWGFNMSVPVFSRMAKPAPLLFGNQQATLFNMIAWIVFPTIQLVTPIMAVVLFGLTQVYIFRRTCKNLHFFEELIIFATKKNNKAKIEGVETYV